MERSRSPVRVKGTVAGEVAEVPRDVWHRVAALRANRVAAFRAAVRGVGVEAPAPAPMTAPTPAPDVVMTVEVHVIVVRNSEAVEGVVPRVTHWRQMHSGDGVQLQLSDGRVVRLIGS